MNRVRGLAAVAATISPIAFGQFVPPPTDLISTIGNAGYQVRYKEVPSGICESVEGVKSYSGYVDVASDQHIFYWFFEARNVDPAIAPLTVWLNGGPGDPSMVGLFSENGPCYVDPSGDIQYNAYSWTNVSNVIYIDQPTQTGFSYSVPVPAYTDPNTGYIVELPNNTCPEWAAEYSCGTYSYANYSLTSDTTPGAAPNVWRTLQGFTGAFPDYSRKGIHLATESYGGHFGPVFAEFFETQNAANISGAVEICLKSLTVINGWFDPQIQYPAYYDFMVNNTYDFHPFSNEELEQMYNAMYGKGNCLDQLNDCNLRNINSVCAAADNFCYAIESMYDDITNRDEYDLRELSPDPYPYQTVPDYLNTPEIQEAIGAFQNFSYAVTNLGGGTVANAYAATGDDAKELGIINDIKKLLEQGIYVAAIHGDADYNCNWLGGEQVAAEINAPGWSAAGYQNITTADNIVHGVVKQSGNYTFGRIYESGHQVPFYQPLTALTIFERVLAHTDLATGKIHVNGPLYKSQGPKTSTFHNGAATTQPNVTDPSQTYNYTIYQPNLLPASNRRSKRFSRLVWGSK